MASTAATEAVDGPSLAPSAKGQCTYCGLPVGTVDTPAYCCYGCRFAHAVVQEQGNEGAIRWTVIRLGLAIFFTMNLMAFTMTMWSLDVYDVEPDPFQLTLFEVFRWLSMLFALPVLLLLGVPLLQNAIGGWRQRVYSTDLLIGLAVFAAYATSVINVVRESGTIYFEVGATVLVMITLGRWIEAAGKQKATEALDKLLTLLPDTVHRITAQTPDADSGTDSSEESIAAANVALGDTLHIRAGERFPTDATITLGRTTVDEQVFTGESIPVEKSVGNSVLAGTVNLDGDLHVQVTSKFREGSFGRLLAMLQEARAARGYYQRLADRVASWFFPVITLVAAATLAWHWSAGVGIAIQTMMSVLLIACPCALGLATPLAVWTSLSTAIKHQVLFRSGEAVERLAGVKAICLDKTGTLTTGTPQVSQKAFFGDDSPDDALRLAGHLASSSTHPFSRAVAAYCLRDDQPSYSPTSDAARPLKKPVTDVAVANANTCTTQLLNCPDLAPAANGCALSSGQAVHVPSGRDAGVEQMAKIEGLLGKIDSVSTPSSSGSDGPFIDCSLHALRTVPGGGVEANLSDGRLVRLGSVEFSCCSVHRAEMQPAGSVPDLCVACQASVSLPLRIQLDRLRMAADQQAASIVLLSIDRVPAVGFLISEAVRSEARLALTKLAEQTEALHVLSGDRPSKGRFLTEHLNVPGLNVTCSLNPEQKVLRVAEVRREHGNTVMVGDGINDAPALAASDVGIAMGCGADVSRDSAQVCLLSNDLTRIPWAIDLARRTQKVIRQNLFWAFGYNAVGVCLAASGLLNPAIAAGLMIASSLLVISNSLRLLSTESP